jgi:TP901 family phage tail tape measure protein
VTDYNLGTAKGVIELEYKGDGAKRASRDLGGIGSSADQANRRMSKAGTSMVATGALIAGGLAFATKTAGDFEYSMSQVGAVLGASEGDMEALRAKAIQLGKDTAFSAGESAKAMEELAKAGLNTTDILNGAADATVALAAAGQVDMATAAGIASSAMNSFNIKAEDMAHVSDLISGAANKSATDVVGVGEAFKYVAPLASATGVSIEDTTAGIAALAKVGIQGSMAGTTLRGMLQNLTPASESAAKKMKELGIITEDNKNRFYDAAGNTKSLADISGILQESLSGLSDEQKSQALNTIFGARAMAGATALAKQGKKGFQDLKGEIGDVSAEEVAADRMDNLKGSIELMKGSLETLLIQVGTPLLNGFRKVVDLTTTVLNVFLSLPGPVLRAITVFAQVAAVGLILAGAFLKIRAAIQAGSLAFTLLTGPIGLIIAAIAALVAAFVYFYTTNEKFRAFVQGIAADLKDLFGKAIDYLIPKLQEFGQFLVSVFNASLPYIQKFGQMVVSAFNAALPTIEKVGAFLQHLGQIFIEEVVPAAQEAVGWIKDSLVGAFNKVVPEIQKIIPVVQDLVGSLVGLFEAITSSGAFEFLVNVLKIVAEFLIGTVLPLLTRLGGIVVHVFVDLMGNALRAALGVIRGVLNIIIGVIKIFTGLLTGNWGKAWDGVLQILRGVGGIIVSVLKGLLSSAGSILKGLGQIIVAGVKAIPGLLKGLGGLFIAAGRFIIDQFVQGFKDAAGLVEGIASNVWNFVKGLMNGAIAKINAALEFTIDPPGPGKVVINPPDIPALATGGLVSTATLLVAGEGNDTEGIIPLRQLWAEIDRVYKVGQVNAAESQIRSEARTGGQAHKSSGGTATLVEGRLSIDRSGRAFIRGVAVSQSDDDDDFNDTLGRMN